MLSDTIKSRLAERFAAPLPEFHKRRVVFWNDENGEFAEDVDELSLPGVTLVKLSKPATRKRVFAWEQRKLGDIYSENFRR